MAECVVMSPSHGCHTQTVKSILHENLRKVVWLCSLCYVKIHRRGWRRRRTM